MELLSLSFKILTYCGVWRTESCSSSYKSTLYTVYMVTMVVFVYSYTITVLIDLCFVVDNVDDFTENIYMCLPVILASCKMFSLIVNNKKIRTLVEVLLTPPCKPENEEERKIQDKYDKSALSMTKGYFYIIEFSGFCNVLSTLLTDLGKRQLGFRAWLPFDYASSNLYYVVYFHQIIVVSITILVHIATDTLICGFILQTCSQIEILEYRVENVAKGNKLLLHTCVYHHDFIYRFSGLINDTFVFIVFCQFVISTFLVCFSLYQMLKQSFSAYFVQLAIYMFVVLAQIFYFCYWGNKLKFKSVEIVNAIFGMDWLSLDNDAKLTLLMMMRKAMTPIEFVCAYVINMNLESFVGLVKVSYSVYNLLQQTNQE